MKKKIAIGRGGSGIETTTIGPGVTGTTTKDETGAIGTTVTEVAVIMATIIAIEDEAMSRVVGETTMEAVEHLATQPLR